MLGAAVVVQYDFRGMHHLYRLNVGRMRDSVRGEGSCANVRFKPRALADGLTRESVGYIALYSNSYCHWSTTIGDHHHSHNELRHYFAARR